MKRLLILILTLTIYSSCCKNETNFKEEYLRIGFNNGHETYVSVKGNGSYHMEYTNLYSHGSCTAYKIADNVSYFSLISKEEYDSFINKKSTPAENTIQ